ncbi:MAG: hypothetical protein VYD19_04810 [Myxococcota bacterium]|nr:hypothetical protein [Myxococcota bacterium]
MSIEKRKLSRWLSLCLLLSGLHLCQVGERPVQSREQALKLPPEEYLQRVELSLPGHPHLILTRGAEVKDTALAEIKRWSAQIGEERALPIDPIALARLLKPLGEGGSSISSLQLPALSEPGAASLRRRYGFSEATPTLTLNYVAGISPQPQIYRLLVGRELDGERTWVARAPKRGQGRGALFIEQLPGALRTPLTRPPPAWVDLRVARGNFGELTQVTVKSGAVVRWALKRQGGKGLWRLQDVLDFPLSQERVQGVASTLRRLRGNRTLPRPEGWRAPLQFELRSIAGEALHFDLQPRSDGSAWVALDDHDALLEIPRYLMSFIPLDFANLYDRRPLTQLSTVHGVELSVGGERRWQLSWRPRPEAIAHRQGEGESESEGSGEDDAHAPQWSPTARWWLWRSGEEAHPLTGARAYRWLARLLKVPTRGALSARQWKTRAAPISLKILEGRPQPLAEGAEPMPLEISSESALIVGAPWGAQGMTQLRLVRTDSEGGPPLLLSPERLSVLQTAELLLDVQRLPGSTGVW